METINTVNFEDLFDFSPEPVDRANANGQEDSEVKTGYFDNPSAAASAAPVATTRSVPVVAHKRRLDNDDNRESNNVFADFEAVLAGHFAEDKKDFKLSTSVPSNWSGGASSTPSSSADTSGGRVFTVGSVGQLLNDLPEASVSPSQGQDVSASTPVPPTKSKRGRKPGQRSLRTDMKTKLERSRQSARECRARKKLRYQYLDDLILEREKANDVLREELMRYQKWCHELDKGRIPDGLQNVLKEMKEGQ